MSLQTYCAIADVKDILSDNGVLYRTDDDESGSVAGSGTESTVQANAIERAAAKMNMYLAQTCYKLSELASNEWCKWCNAVMAAVELCKRRGNPIPPMLLEDLKEFKELLSNLARGLVLTIPGTLTKETGPNVTNVTVERWRYMPIRRQRNISTGALPDGTSKHFDEYPRYGDYSI